MSTTARASTAEILRGRLDGLEAQVDESVEVLRGALRRELDQIGSDADLTPAGRRKREQELEDTARGRMDALRSDYTARREELIRLAHVSTFGRVDRDLLAYRDAADRAARLDDPGEAERVIRRALSRGDALLASAIAEHAYSKDWRAVLAAYAAGDEARAELVELLGEVGPEPGQSGPRRRSDPRRVFRWALR